MIFFLSQNLPPNLDAVRRQPKGSVSTDFEIKKAVEYWLKRASKRINERLVN